MTVYLDSAMIIRVAKAINGPHIALPGDPPEQMERMRENRWNMLTDQNRAFCIQQARAVLTEMRQPTMAMILSCADLDGSQQQYWHRSIDRALSDKDI